ncbi:MAG: type II secretion system protein [Armatimonadota bacterium]
MIARRSRRGFTLIELLTVIAIIAVLAAILMPVINRSRESARQAACLANLHQIAVAMKSYWTDYRAYPPPPVQAGGRWHGGVSALFPDYVEDSSLLVCPDDDAYRARDATVGANVPAYSSYNAAYNYYGYFAPGAGTVTDWLGQSHPASAIPQDSTAGWPVDAANAVVLPAQLNQASVNGQCTIGIPSLAKFPRLSNRYAPDTTVITHCYWHRRRMSGTARSAQIDTAINLGGNGGKIKLGLWDRPNPAGTDPVGAVPWCYQPSNF